MTTETTQVEVGTEAGEPAIEVADSEVSEVAEEQYVDNFEVLAAGYINTDNVVTVKLPKIDIELVGGQPVVKREPISIVIEDGPGVCANLCKLAKLGFPELSIKVFTDETKKEVSATWVFNGARIKIMDLGAIVSVEQPDKRVVQCDVEYVTFSVDGVEV
jgi:hypothetical protein